MGIETIRVHPEPGQRLFEPANDRLSRANDRQSRANDRQSRANDRLSRTDDRLSRANHRDRLGDRGCACTRSLRVQSGAIRSAYAITSRRSRSMKPGNAS
jgi:hypothetical protein